jgi:hypothetical protein
MARKVGFSDSTQLPSKGGATRLVVIGAVVEGIGICGLVLTRNLLFIPLVLIGGAVFALGLLSNLRANRKPK